MTKYRFQAEKVILLFYFIINLSTFILIYSSGIYIGDPVGESLSLALDSSLLIFLGNFCVYIFIYLIYRCFTSKRYILTEMLINRIEVLLFLGTSIALIGFLWIDYGRAEHQSTSPFGFVFRLIPYSVFWLLYVSIIPKWSVKSVLLIFYYVLVKVMMGWTGILLALFWVIFIKLYNSKERSFIFFVASVFALVFLYFVAPFAYYLKYYVRYGGEFAFNYPFLLSKLTARLSSVQNALYIYENSDSFSVLYSKYLFDGFYFVEPFLALLPRSLLGIGTENFETIYVSAVTGYFNPGVVFYLSLSGKLIAYANLGIYNLINFLFVVTALVTIISLMLRARFRSSSNPFMFYILIQFALSGSIEELSYTLYGVCFVFVVSKVNWRRINESRC